jgi:superfamily II DNA/RNA helicase
MNYIDLIANNAVAEGLKKQNITIPTPIQEQVFKPFMEGKDIIARSETGSGKTLGYLVPLFCKMDLSVRGNQAMVLVPTHELAIQVHKQVELLAANSNIPVTSAVIIGNGNQSRQLEALKTKPAIVIGTAGRILELIQKKKISAHTIRTLVIDEADKLLDRNNMDIVQAVRKTMLRDTQTALFSASIERKTIQTAESFLQNPVVIQLTDSNKIPENIEHIFVMVPSRRDKINALRSVCSTLKTKRSLIFINTQFDIDQAYERLSYHHYKVGRLCGSVEKNERKNNMNAFRQGKLEYLIATDIASRGLHVDGIETVINVAVPEQPLDYLHRAGRCGRNLKQGQSICIITPSELKRIKAFESEFKIKFVEKKLEKGNLV